MQIRRKNSIHKAIAAIVLTLLVLILPAGRVLAVDLNRTDSLTVAAVGSSSEAYKEDVAEANVVIDLYQLADAIPVEGYDTYSYAIHDTYGGIEVNGVPASQINFNSVSLSNEQWRDLAQQAAVIVYNSGIPADRTAPAETTIEGLTPGLYLILAHGSDLENYWKTEEGTDELVTIAQSANFIYTYAPAAISLPTKDALTDEDGNIITDEDGIPIISTAGEGDWIYDAQAALKPAIEPRFGGIEITKTIDRFDGTEEATFVFRVIATGNFPDAPDYTYRNVVAIAFDAQTGLSNTAVLTGIRAGAQVTVTEIYTGPRYDAGSLTGPDSNIIEAGEGALLSFYAYNTQNDNDDGGRGIQNHFTNVEGENGNRWEVEQQTAQ